MENIDSNDMMIHIDIIKIINEIAVDQLITTRELNREPQKDSETTNAIFLTAHTHQAVLGFRQTLKVE